MERAGICHSDGFDLAYRIEGEGAPILVIGSAVYYPRLFPQISNRNINGSLSTIGDLLSLSGSFVRRIRGLMPSWLISKG